MFHNYQEDASHTNFCTENFCMAGSNITTRSQSFWVFERSFIYSRRHTQAGTHAHSTVHFRRGTSNFILCLIRFVDAPVDTSECWSYFQGF